MTQRSVTTVGNENIATLNGFPVGKQIKITPAVRVANDFVQFLNKQGETSTHLWKVISRERAPSLKVTLEKTQERASSSPSVSAARRSDLIAQLNALNPATHKLVSSALKIILRVASIPGYTPSSGNQQEVNKAVADLLTHAAHLAETCEEAILGSDEEHATEELSGEEDSHDEDDMDDEDPEADVL